jgi:hypothetical protein
MTKAKTQDEHSRSRTPTEKPSQGIVRDNKGQEQPADKQRAQHVSRTDRGDDPPGKKE